mmetsp:Transcript_24688/g.57537  ORF Transcript_24688/g.57537 Transcript_24688/m.57537 type:complete len:129 (+) Transcript_24688:1073-1459(+)
MKKEIPYCCEVRIDSYREPRPRDAKKLVRMAATILVDRESQKPIVIGRGGQMIKAVGIHARKKLEEFLKNQVSFVPFWMCVCFCLATAGIFFSAFLAQTHMLSFGFCVRYTWTSVSRWRKTGGGVKKN